MIWSSFGAIACPYTNNAFSDLLEATVRLRQKVAVTDALKLLRGLSFRHEDRVQAVVQRRTDLVDEADASVRPGVLLHLGPRVEDVKRAVEVMDVLRVTTGLPSHVFLLAFLRCSESVIRTNRRRELRLHDRPVEQEVIVQSVNVVESREEPSACRLSFPLDLARVAWVVVRDCAHQHFAEAVGISLQLPGDVRIIRRVDCQKSSGVAECSHDYFEISGAQKVEGLAGERRELVEVGPVEEGGVREDVFPTRAAEAVAEQKVRHPAVTYTFQSGPWMVTNTSSRYQVSPMRPRRRRNRRA